MNETDVGKKARVSLDQVIAEHKELRKLIANLRTFLTSQPDRDHQDPRDWSSALSKRVVNLHDMVSHHFREEDDADLLGTLEEEHPRATHVIERLRRDHGEILRGFRETLSAAMAAADGDPTGIEVLRKQALTVVYRLERHETDETDLMQRLPYEDLGLGD